MTKLYLIISLLIIFLGLSAVLAWVFQLDVYLQLDTRLPPIEFNTALSFIFCGISLLFLFCEKRVLTACFSIVPLFFGLATLVEYIFHIDLGIDQILVNSYPFSVSSYPGRISPNSALNFCFFTAAAFLFLFSTNIVRYWIGGLFSALILAFSISALMGYSFGLSDVLGEANLTHMSLMAAICFTLVAIAIYIHCYQYVDKSFIWIWHYLSIGMVLLIGCFNLWNTIQIKFIHFPKIKWEISVELFVLMVIFIIVAALTLFLARKAFFLINSLVIAISQAKHNIKVKEMIFRHLGHEIRNPLNTLEGFFQLLEDQPLNDESREILQQSELSLERVNNVIDDLLSYARYEAGKLVLSKKNFVVEAWLNPLINQLKKRAEQKNLEFQVRLDPSVPKTLYGDSFKIAQIILNLCENAIKFTKQGKVTLGLFYNHKESHLHIEVSDTGMGIPLEIQKKIFWSFSQSYGVEEVEGGGLGIGLSICLTYAKMMEGDIALQSKPDEGSTFFVALKVPSS